MSKAGRRLQWAPIEASTDGAHGGPGSHSQKVQGLGAHEKGSGTLGALLKDFSWACIEYALILDIETYITLARG